MRRKSERNKPRSPEKKVEKPTRRTRRRKGTPESDEDHPSDNETLKDLKKQPEIVTKHPSTDSKESNSDGESKQQSVWQVKSADAPTDTGEIQKLKICLQRPSSSERSPRKHHGSSQESADSSEEVRKKRSKKHSHTKDESYDKHENQDDQTVQPETSDAKHKEQVPSSNDKHQALDNQAVQSDANVCAVPSEPVKAEIKSENDNTMVVPDVKQEEGIPKIVLNNDNEQKNSDIAKTDAQISDAASKMEVEVVQDCKIENIKTNCKQAPSEEAKDNNIETTETVENKTIECSSASENTCAVKQESKEDNSGNITKTVVTRLVKNEVEDSSENVKEIKDGTEVENEPKKTSNTCEMAESVVSQSVKNGIKDSTENEELQKAAIKRRKSRSDSEKTESTETSETVQKSESSNNEERVTRKRKWGSKHSTTSDKKTAVAISTDSLKNLISDVKPLSVNDVLLEEKNDKAKINDNKKDSKCEDNREKSLDDKLDMSEMDYEADDPPSEKESDHSEEIEKKRIRSRRSESERNEKSADNGRSRRRISTNENVPEKKSSQPAHKPSEILYITNLVRPFTVLQLKGLLARTGKLIENGFWIDNIKSRCFVRYENEDQAVETRHALHGTRWPASNPKLLHVEFSTSEEMEKCLSSLPPPPPSDNIRRTIDSDKVAMAWLTEQNFKDERSRDREALRDRKQSVREWDLGKHDPAVVDEAVKYPRDIPVEYPKEAVGRDRRDERFDNRTEKRRSRSRSPVRRFKRKEDEAPAKRLDDLFRKTKVTPCIYWLPLTPEQIAVKEEMRRQHMAEHERRKEEIRKQEREREKERQSQRDRRNSSMHDRNRRNSSRSRDRNNH